MKNKEKFEKKNPEFVAEVTGLSLEDLDTRLANLAKDAYRVQEAQEDDEDLAEARETASGLAAPYRDAKQAIKQKSAYLAELVSERTGK
jgi:hypothetical protein